MKKGLVFLGYLIFLLAGLPLGLQAQGTDSATSAREKVVLFFGVYTQWYKFDSALSNYEIKISNAHSEGVQDFPSVKDLFSAKLIILSDVSGGEFTESQIKQIKSCVEQGCGLLVMGGPFTYGLGQFQEKGLAEMLPVKLEPFDLKWEKEGKSFAGSGEILQGIDLAKKPMVYWIHKVEPKEGSTVVMTAGNYPLLVTGTYGKGKVAVFTGTPMGIPLKGQVPFWEWDGWTKMVGNIVNWLIAGR